MKVVNELSTFTVQFTFKGEGGEEVVPDSARYLIYDTDNNRVVLDWTELTPESIVRVNIPASVNAVYQDRRGRKRRTECRVITVQSNYDQDSQTSAEVEYAVRNLRGFDS